MIKKFDDYINEGVRDQMTPKPIESIKKNFSGKSYTNLHDFFMDHYMSVDLHDVFTEDELINMLKNQSRDFATDIRYYIIDKGITMKDIPSSQEVLSTFIKLMDDNTFEELVKKTTDFYNENI